MERPWTAEQELLYVTTARADTVAKIVRPALEGGRLVISDRYEMSTRAYQGAGRGVDAEHLEWVNRAATGGLVPDLTMVLDIDAEAGWNACATLADTRTGWTSNPSNFTGAWRSLPRRHRTGHHAPRRNRSTRGPAGRVVPRDQALRPDLMSEL